MGWKLLGVEDPEMNVTHNPGCEGFTVQWRKKVHKQSLIAGVMQGVMVGVLVSDHSSCNRTEHVLCTRCMVRALHVLFLIILP